MKSDQTPARSKNLSPITFIPLNSFKAGLKNVATWASSKMPDNVVGSFSHPLIPGPRLELLTTHNTFHSCDTQDDNTKLQRTFVSGLSMFAQFSEAKNVFHICMKVYAFYVLCFLCHSIFFSNKSWSLHWHPAGKKGATLAVIILRLTDKMPAQERPQPAARTIHPINISQGGFSGRDCIQFNLHETSVYGCCIYTLSIIPLQASS